MMCNIVIHLMLVAFLIFVFNYVIFKLFNVDLSMIFLNWFHSKIYGRPPKNDGDDRR
jgi:hypothetical protein